MKVNLYSDINAIDPLNKPLATNVEAIFSSLYNILNTRPGERLHLPSFGCNIEDILFEPMDDGTALLIYQRIIEAIEVWEKRVTLDYGQTDVVPDYDNNAYDITIVFSINSLEEETFSFQGSIKLI